MKYLLSIPALLLLSTVCFGQTSSNINKITDSHNIPISKCIPSLLTPSIPDDYIFATHGNINVVSRNINTILEGMTFPSLYPSRDGNFFLQGFSGRGGTFSKIDDKGTMIWTIDQYDHNDNSAKFFASFEQCSELSDGTVQVYGGEGVLSGVVSGYVPKKLLISSNGVILGETSTRHMVDTLGSSAFGIPTFTNIVPGEILFCRGVEFYDVDDKSALILYSMDTELRQRKNILRIETGMSEFAGISGVLPYTGGTFLVALQGKSAEQPIFHIAFFQYKNDYTLIKKTIIPTNGNSQFVVTDNYSIVIASSITTATNKPLHLRKIDQNGAQLWEKVVDGLKDIPLKVNNFYTSKDGGFIVTGETWFRKADGSVDYNNGARTGIIIKLTADGELLWYYTTGRENLWNRMFAVAEADNGDIITVCNSGHTLSARDYDESMEIVRLRPTSSSVKDEKSFDENNALSLAPNPANSTITITCPGNISSIRVYNSLGVNIEDSCPQFIGNDLHKLDVSGLPNGLYSVQVLSSNGVMHKPFIISR
ncbi:MAG: T9SS type A sorting domain-containing protein [Candidatus Kapaibacterium sp.]